MKRLLLILISLYFTLSITFSQQASQIKGMELPYITKNDVVVKHFGYTLSYNEKYEQANWVAYVLTREKTQKSYERSNKFLVDPMVKTGSARLTVRLIL